MDMTGLQTLIVFGGLSLLALVVARYSVNAIFNTMQFFLVRFQNRNQK